jgi:phospholipid/cholesterol/gamma-HCH transport system ATP-binding protein
MPHDPPGSIHHGPAGSGADAGTPALLEVQDLAVQAGGRTVLRSIDFTVRTGEVLVIVGPSGCGKSTLLRHLVGLQRPLAGRVLLNGLSLHDGDEDALAALRRRFGVMFQAGALWSSMSLGENLMLPLRLFTPLTHAQRAQQAREKLALVGLQDGFDLMPAQLSGGMRKRAALARALALDPPLLFLDEPGSGLDPLNVARLDELVLELRHHLGKTVVMVTHDIASVFAVADRALYLDEQAMTMTALGTPQDLLLQGPPAVQRFLAPQGAGARGRAGLHTRGVAP